MQSQYHPGHYKRDKWSCCVNADKNNIGCREAYSYEETRPLGSVGFSLSKCTGGGEAIVLPVGRRSCCLWGGDRAACGEVIVLPVVR